ncbi:MAG: hypothetical protein IKL55_00070 [Clostridia bacterium]|nr:hypothetical protein [Clostridia bacterium]
MKNKKLLVGIALLIVVLVIGIGYAAITGSLTISGTATATADDSNLKVQFTGVTNPATTTDGVTATATEGSTSATLNVTGLTTAGQSKTATYTIANNSDELKALVDVKTEEITNTGFFSIDATVANPTTELEPGDETTVTVTVTLNKTPIEEVSGTINVELEATAVLAD